MNETMTDFKHVEEQIGQLRRAGDYYNLQDHPVEDTIMCVCADTMQALLDVAEAAERIYNRPIHKTSFVPHILTLQSDEDRLRDALAKLQEQSDAE